MNLHDYNGVRAEYTKGTHMKTEKIALLGMMASGKTTLGQALSTRLSAPFVDIDRIMERITGMPVAGIFARHGEAEFRVLEQMVIGEYANRTGPLVMALGGGAYLQERVRQNLRHKAVTVYLKVSPAELVRRLEATDIASRPVLSASPDWRKRAAEIAAEREQAYGKADLVFDAGANDVAALAENLAEAICRHVGGNLAAAGLEAVHA